MLVTAVTPAGFNSSGLLETNVDAPSLERDYSILGWANYIKANGVDSNVQVRFWCLLKMIKIALHVYSMKRTRLTAAMTSRNNSNT